MCNLNYNYKLLSPVAFAVIKCLSTDDFYWFDVVCVRNKYICVNKRDRKNMCYDDFMIL